MMQIMLIKTVIKMAFAEGLNNARGEIIVVA
jgi:hypothetical protein